MGYVCVIVWTELGNTINASQIYSSIISIVCIARNGFNPYVLILI